MPLPAHLEAFWSDFLRASPSADHGRYYEAFFFGDSEEMANELAELVLLGTKRATAGSLWSYEVENQPLPQAGNLSVVTNFSGKPLCVIETQSVEVVPFNEVTAEFAAIEGEGDGTLSFWKRAHQEFFARDCARIGLRFSESMPVVCERFAVVYQAGKSAA
ncbi:MAG: ASCH domain-containing protein [Usitatibacteraceae bacterium]